MENQVSEASMVDLNIATKINDIEKKFPSLLSQYQSFNRGNNPKDILIWMQKIKNIISYLKIHYQEFGILRERQIRIFEDMAEFIASGKTEGTIKLPTGVGKTILFLEASKAINQRTLIVVPTNILLDQTVNKIQEFNLDLEVGTVNSRSKTFGKQTTVTTYASLVSQINRGTISPKDFDLVFLDEAHRSLTDPIQESIDKFRKENKLIVNFTATDKYGENKKLNSEIIFEMSIDEAVTEGLLCGIKCIFVKTNISVLDAKVSKSGEYNTNDLNKILQKGGVLLSCIDVYSKLFKD